LSSTQILSIVANSLLNVIAGKPQWAGVRSAAQSDMNVGMVRIEVRDGYPLQPQIQVLFYPSHQLSGVPLQIEAFAEFRRDDQLEQALVAGGLPLAQRLGNIDAIVGGAESSLFDGVFLGRAPA
jgi:hypothetical protein